MRYFFVLILFLSYFFSAETSFCQADHPQQNQKPWNAKWIAAPSDNGLEYGVYYFRKNISINTKPASFNIYISADNRYKLYVNGTLVSLGPARGDTYFWNYETVDLAPYLKAGKNTVAALVWNEAQYRPEAQISVRTGLIIQGSSVNEEILNTNETWKCIKDEGHLPVPGYFFAASKGEMVDMNLAVKSDWTAANYSDSTWLKAANLLEGKLKGMAWGIDWALVPSTLPPREMIYQRIPKLRSAVGINVPPTFPQKKGPLTIPANTKAVLLLDQTFETNAYVT
ncbi:MAG: alpha-rhamnosidase, partial [Sphingobacteriaceae bacterium]